MQGQTSDQPVGLDTDQMKIHTDYHFAQSSLTFTLGELSAALQLIRDQNDIFNSHEDDGPEPIPSPCLEHGACPACILRAHRHKCYACGTKIHETVCTIHMTTQVSAKEVAASNCSDLEGVPEEVKIRSLFLKFESPVTFYQPEKYTQSQ
ncbi:hypothetical protein C8R48DRAFT_779167 [Suillus tomentosus]|nr:hypothetical protein C8R48DRAFT_779167 [Suillus tomentosus]